MEVTKVPWKNLLPNPWNQNETTEEEDQAIIESLQLYGFVDPLTVRKHPTRKTRYEIIDGEHRYNHMRAMKAKEVSDKLRPVYASKEVPCIVLELTDREAMKLTVILNETRGRANSQKLGDLLAKIYTGDLTELGEGLPYHEKQLDDLMLLSQFNWAKSLPENPTIPVTEPTPKEDKEKGDTGYRSLVMGMPTEVRALFYEVAEQVRKRMLEMDAKVSENEKAFYGQVLEVLLAEYLAARGME